MMDIFFCETCFCKAPEKLLGCFRSDTVIQCLLVQWEVVLHIVPDEYAGYLEK